MRTRISAERIVRWYPPAWRQRYGEEMLALLEDTYDDGVPWRGCLALARAATIEQLRETRLIGRSAGWRDSARSGSLLVLCGWAAFMVAGAAFAKFAEHWEAAIPGSGARHLPAIAYDIVQVAAFVGVLIVALAAIVAIPSFIRMVRGGDFGPVRTPLVRALVVTSVTLVAGTGVAIWAHRIGPSQRNGGSLPYTGVGMVGAALVVASIACCTAAVVAAASRLELSDRVCRLYRVLALALTVAMAAILGGVIAWWVAMATRAPRFLDTGLVALPRGSVPPALIAAGLLMVVGLAVSLFGAGRVLRVAGR